MKIINYNNYSVYLDETENCFNELKLTVNNKNIVDFQPIDYFNYIQALQYHTNIPRVGLNMYSFSLNPEKYQPSGSWNFSKLTNMEIIFKTNKYITSTNQGTLHFFALNHNIFRTINGQGGVGFSS